MSGAGAVVSRQLEGRVALVTGAASGIGRGIAEVLHSRGASLVLVDINKQAAESAANEIAGEGSAAIGLFADVTDPSTLASAVDSALERFGEIDICVANAGVIGGPGFTERRDYNDDDWDATHSVNVRGVVNTNDAVRPHMIEKGRGRIINIASHGGRTPRGADGGIGSVQVPYGVSKAGVIQWTMHLALQIAKHGVTVNVVCPGTLWTPMWERIAQMRSLYDSRYEGMEPNDIFDAQIKGSIPLGRPQTPTDIGDAVAFFASDDARVITGQALNVNGGAIMN
ncbi:MAG: SDR family oxidoreductase [Chloroflexi bacterium]|nr:SDR family oxidoreductase [Chloroflexota bacterium]